MKFSKFYAVFNLKLQFLKFYYSSTSSDCEQSPYFFDVNDNMEKLTGQTERVRISLIILQVVCRAILYNTS